MNSRDLTLAQVDELCERLRKSTFYLAKLRKRMEECRFDQNDTIFQQVKQASDATQQLWMSLHYLACDKVRGK